MAWTGRRLADFSGTDADLHILRAMWKAAQNCGADMRPTDRHLIRQALDASLRLGENLLQLSAIAGATTCQSFPRNTKTTRIRTFPPAFHLEFLSTGSGVGTNPSIFLKLTEQDITVGLRAPAFASEEARKAKMKAFRAHAPDVFKDLRQAQAKTAPPVATATPAVWQLAAPKPLIHQDQCGSGVNDWLKVRSTAAAETIGAFTISKTIPDAAPTVEKLLALLKDASQIFQPFLTTAPPSNRPTDTTTGAATLH